MTRGRAARAARGRGIDIIGRSISETEVQRALMKHFQIRKCPDVVGLHIPNGEKRSALAGAILVGMGVLPGAPDLLFIIAGKVHFLELKRTAGRKAFEQVKTHEQLRRAGAIVATAYGLDPGIAQLLEWGAMR